MAQTYFGSTLRSGSGTLTDTVDGGYVVTVQTTTVTTNADGSASSTSVTIPAGSQLLNFFIDQTQNEAVGGGTATAINATIGTAAAGTQYLSATDVIGGGRAALSFTAAQLAAMVGDAFPEVSKTATGTKSSADIWDKRAEFDKMAKEFADHSAALVAVLKKDNKTATAEFKTAATAVAGDCKGCHDKFRMK
jgi:hypothetical protein